MIWVQGLQKGAGGWREPPVALDARTHRPIGTRLFVHGKVYDEEVYRFLGTVPATKVSFLVPKAKVPREYGSFLGSFPYGFVGPEVSADGSENASLREARDVLGRSPLWLGPSFQAAKVRAEALAVARGLRPLPAARGERF